MAGAVQAVCGLVSVTVLNPEGRAATGSQPAALPPAEWQVFSRRESPTASLQGSTGACHTRTLFTSPQRPPHLGWGILSESPQSLLEFFLGPAEDNAFET